MLDALIPASQVLEEKLSAGEDPISAFILSGEAATAGAESTIQMQAQVSLAYHYFGLPLFML
jgi:dihydroxyacetone kinase